jgi:hypothetical protein
MDTGPKVQGRILDLYMWSCHEALDFGRKAVQVTVLRLGWSPSASSPGLIDRLFRRREAARRAPAIAEAALSGGPLPETTAPSAEQPADAISGPPSPATTEDGGPKTEDASIAP